MKKNIEKSFFLFFCCGVVLFLPLSRQLTSFCTIILILISLVRIINRSKPLVKWKFVIPLCSLFFIYFISLLYTENFKEGWSHIETKLSLLAFPIIFGLNRVTEKQKKHIIFFFIIGIVFSSLVCFSFAAYNYKFSQHIWGENKYFFFYQFLTEPIGIHTAYFSLFTSFSIIIILNYLFDQWGRRSFKHIISIIFLLIYLVIFNLLLSSRMPSIVFLFVLIVFIFIKLLKNKVLTFSFISGVIVLLILLLNTDNFFHERFSKFNSLKYDIENPDFKAWNGVTTRLAIWKCSWEIIKAHPIFGVGEGDSQNELTKIYDKENFFYALSNGYNAHNQYVQTILSTGFIGLIILLVNIFGPFYFSINYKDTIAIIFYLFIFGVFMTETYLARYQGVLFFSFFNSLFLLQSSPPFQKTGNNYYVLDVKEQSNS